MNSIETFFRDKDSKPERKKYVIFRFEKKKDKFASQ
jgi:hypothetical protein